MDDETRAKLLAARAERAAAAERAKLAHDDLCLSLDDRYSSELGKRGEAWEMANEENSCGEGPIVVKLGDPVAYKMWSAKPGAAPEDMFAFVRPMVVYPEGAVFASLAVRRPELLGRALIACLQLFGQNKAVFLGKV